MKNTIIDFDRMLERVQKDGRIHDYKIDKLEVYEDFVHYKRKYINHEYYENIEYFLFPNENLGVYKLYVKNKRFKPNNLYRYYVDMVTVNKFPTYWNIKDLYIDFIIKNDGKYYVADIDEFNDAIKTGELNIAEVNSALNGLNNILKGYYAEFDIEKYILNLTEKYRTVKNVNINLSSI